MKKIFVVGGCDYYASWINDYRLVDNPKDADLVFFTGGEDVSPSLYGKKTHESTYSNLQRDLKEKAIFESIIPGQVCLGVCRGSQFLCAMNGGILVQDCTNHAIGHTHQINNGKICYQITSTHHQMQYPFTIPKKHYDILYYTNDLSDYYQGDGIDVSLLKEYGEPEIVYYHLPEKPRCLAIQGHPEMMNVSSPTIIMLNELLNSILNNR